ncbi:MAG TPA: HD domain-containing phosphohydrolase [Acidimicrobiia bacterium]|nr:HD domain-containing phosphohydrolase [Acidimicrobiia bacterium]
MPSTSTVRLSELVATLSLVSDLGMGRPVERVLRQTVIAMRLAELADAGDEVRSATYYTSLLTWVGCAADTSDLAELFGDEMGLFGDTHDGDLAGTSLAVFMLRHLGRGTSPVRRVSLASKFVATAGRSVRQVMVSHCQSTGELAARLGLGDHVHRPLVQAFERWDGRGVPGAAGRDDLALAARIVQLADAVEAFHFSAGDDAAVDVARQRRGTHFDPELVDVFCSHSTEVLAGIDEISAWDEVIALDPRLGEELSDEQLDTALEALADFADLKSPCRAGHSRGVAATAADAATALGLGAGDVQMIRRAALVHDVGMIGVPSGVWDEPRPWSLSQRERARTHPYLLERMLARTPLLSDVARCASLHHERLDGSGYPHGLRGDALPLPARIIAAADVHNALVQPRPHREPFDAARAAEILREEVRAGHLDGEVVNAVLRAGGERVRRRPELPGGVTPREASVLVCLARGRSNAEIAKELSISRKTVSSHLEHIYAKLGISTRTEAALFAMQHGFTDGGQREPRAKIG